MKGGLGYANADPTNCRIKLSLLSATFAEQSVPAKAGRSCYFDWVRICEPDADHEVRRRF